MRLPFLLLDVFTEVPFAGNQLCVVPEPPADLSGEQMQTLANEIGFSETTFVPVRRADGYDVRIFTPLGELPFAGHPTLGTAFALVAEGGMAASLVQSSPAGQVPVEVDVAAGMAWMRQLTPTFGDEFRDRDLMARACRMPVGDLHPELPAQVVSTGLGPLLIPFRDEEALRRAARERDAIVEVCRESGGADLYLFAIRGDGDVMARMFDESDEIGEDPATGSAAGPLGAYLAARGLAGMPGSCVVAQGEMVGRPSFLHVEVHEEDGELVVRVGGGVRVVGEGAFRL